MPAQLVVFAVMFMRLMKFNSRVVVGEMAYELVVGEMTLDTSTTTTIYVYLYGDVRMKPRMLRKRTR